jgi:hypothetical protein
MSIKVVEDIQFFALDAFSENLVKARMNITRLRESINNTDTHVNTVAIDHQQLDVAMKQYNAARITMAKKKHDVLQKLIKKYPSLDEAIIRSHLDLAINDYENNEINKLNKPIEVVVPTAKPTVTIKIPVYATPTRQDMAVLLVYFNACSYKKLAQNLLLTYQTLLRAGIPVYLVEHCFPGQVPLMPANGTTIFNTKSESYMFYKENLLNWLMPKVPPQYTKFFTMDCDLVFEKETWYDDVSVLLDTHDVVQPFHNAFWLGSDLSSIINTKTSFVSNKTTNIESLSFIHPGFAWAFKRDYIEPRGVYDYNILGIGDCIIGSSVIRKNILDNSWKTNSPYWMLDKYKEYYELFENNISTFYDQSVYHLWHGALKNRRYNNRYQEFKRTYVENAVVEMDELFSVNADGLYEFNIAIRDKMNEVIFKYFESRDEDGV